MRISRGRLVLSKNEIWNANVHLAKITRDILVQFKESKRVGYPGRLSTSAEWDEVIDAMIFSFSEICKDFPNDPIVVYLQNHRTLTVKFDVDKNGKLLDEIPESVKEDSQAYNKKIENGLDLYAEYFMDLWD